MAGKISVTGIVSAIGTFVGGMAALAAFLYAQPQAITVIVPVDNLREVVNASESAPPSTAPATTTPVSVTLSTPQPAATPEPGVFRSRDLAVRVDRIMLSRYGGGSQFARGVATLTVENRGQTPISILAYRPRQSLTLALSNGVTLTPSATASNLGLGFCDAAQSECRARAADRFTQIDPQSQVIVNLQLGSGTMTAEQRLDFADVASGALVAPLLVLDGAEERVVQVSLPNVVVQH